LCRLLSQPRGSTVREQLAKEVATFDVVYGSQPVVHLFWNRTFELLRWMDVVCDSDDTIRALHVDCPPSWVAWATAHALQYNKDVDVQDIAAIQQLALQVLLHVERRRRQWELQRCDTSLREVADLLDTPNMAPFLCDHRTQVTYQIHITNTHLRITEAEGQSLTKPLPGPRMCRKRFASGRADDCNLQAGAAYPDRRAHPVGSGGGGDP
jgi:hypothetical protein